MVCRGDRWVLGMTRYMELMWGGEGGWIEGNVCLFIH